MLELLNSHNYPLNNLKKEFSKVFKFTLGRLDGKLKRSSVSLSFSNKKEIKELNKKYRNRDIETDVLSFKCEVDFVKNYLGDIVICYPIAKKQSIEYGHSLKRELCFLFLHGLLHLFGYDHKEIDQEKIMFSLQDLILNELNIKRF